MVDPTKGIGSLQNLISGTRVSEPSQPRKSDVRETNSGKDEVFISDKALNTNEAYDASGKVRSLLEKDTSQSLSAGRIYDESL